MDVQSINIEKARELKKMRLENPTLVDKFYVYNELFHGIIGKEEFKKISSKMDDETKKDLVLISITEPDNDYIEKEYIEGFHDVLETKFWDIEKDITDSLSNVTYSAITKTEGQKIKEFILKNKDKCFLIHCHAGISRSAGVGCAVECIVNFGGNIYEYQTSYSDIKSHQRYAPNYTVFDSICR